MNTSVFARQDRRSSFSQPSARSVPRTDSVIPRWIPVGLLSVVGAVGPIPLRAQADNSTDVVSVYSSASPAYIRSRQPGGSFKPETYAFGKGGAQDRGQKDATFDQVGFVDVARLIAPSLASQNYVPCNPKDPRSAGLLIMVYWGTTIGTDSTSSSAEYQNAQALIPARHAPLPAPASGINGSGMAFDPRGMGGGLLQSIIAAIPKAEEDAELQQSAMMTEMANRQRDRQDLTNASILGYLPELQRVDSFRSPALAQRRQDVVDEIEESRYYVVLLAYDFQLLWQHKQRKLLWETRFSVRENRNDFGKILVSMAQDASRYFGQSSDGLIRGEHLREPRIILGEPSVISYETGAEK